MKIAYFIMSHHKPEQLVSLMNAIYDESNIYLIHVDSKADSSMHDIAINLAAFNSNVHVLPSRSLTWACWSLVQVELDAIKHLLAIDQDWKYYINLSGQDMPLLNQTKIKDFLGKSGSEGQNFLTVEHELNQSDVEKISHFWIEDCGTMRCLGKRSSFEEYFAPGIKPYTGAQWKILNRPFADYSVTSALSFDMQDYFRYTYLPDELYFQTLIMNSPFKDTVVSKNYRYLKMDVGEHYGFHRPITLTSNFLMDMYATDALFARKFDSDVDRDIIRIIESILKN